MVRKLDQSCQQTLLKQVKVWRGNFQVFICFFEEFEDNKDIWKLTDLDDNLFCLLCQWSWSLKSTRSDSEFSEMLLSENQLFGSSRYVLKAILLIRDMVVEH